MKMQININVFIEIFEPFKRKLMRDHPKQQVIIWSIRKFHKSLPAGFLTSLTWYDTVYMYMGIIANFRLSLMLSAGEYKTEWIPNSRSYHPSLDKNVIGRI